MKTSLPGFVAALAAGTFGVSSTVAQSQQAKPFLLPIQCAAGYIPTTAERGCIKDRTAEISRIKGAEARSVRATTGSGVASVPPQATIPSSQSSQSLGSGGPNGSSSANANGLAPDPVYRRTPN